MLGGFEMDKTDKLIKSGTDLIMKDLDTMSEKLKNLIEEINADYENGKLLISEEQWYHIIILVGAITQHDAERISEQVSELESKGHITGKLRELIDLAIKFRNLDFE